MPRNLSTPPAENPWTTPSRVTAIGARERECAQAPPGATASPPKATIALVRSVRRQIQPCRDLECVDTTTSPLFLQTGSAR
jgi:hypothetical protein